MVLTSNWSALIRFAAPGLLLLLLAAGCGGDDDSSSADESEPTETAESDNADAGAEANQPAEPDDGPEETAPETATPTATADPTATPEPDVTLDILVTNDDGHDSEGIDMVVQALLQLPDVEITVVAPLENQSGSSDTVSDSAVTASEATTASGYPVVAVDGTPADSVNHALSTVFDQFPDLIVSGANDGQNVGPLAAVSGTVGAARTGARQGVPAFAISQAGLTVEADFASGIPFLVDWIESNREAVLAADQIPAEVWSLNVASCGAGGSVRGLVEVPLATEFVDDEPFGIDCLSTLENPDDDATALSNGFAALTQIPEALVLGNPVD